MTRKVTFIAVVGACAALLAPGGAATAAGDGLRPASQGHEIRSAAFGPLTGATARRLALRLARQTARERDVRWWQLSAGRRVSPNRVTFAYADRSRNDVYCTATVVVEQPSRRLRRTSFVGGLCRGVPSEALAIESATARFIRGVRAEANDVSDARFDVLDDFFACSNVRVPRSRRADVATLFEAYEVAHILGTIEGPMDALVRELLAIDPQRPELAPATRRWIAINNGTMMLALHLNETLLGDDAPCPTVRRWARAGWSAAAAPEGISTLRSDIAGLAAAERGLVRIARALLELGVSPRAAQAFTPSGVLALTASPRTCAGAQVGCAGG